MPNPKRLVRLMKPEEVDHIKKWRKLDKEVDELVFLMTRWKKWEDSPPIVCLIKGQPVGYHAFSSTKSGYLNSMSQFVLEEHRGKGLAGAMIDKLLQLGQQQGMKRLRFRTPKNSDGYRCWIGFGVVPFGECEKDYWFDLDISQVPDISSLLSNGASLHLPPSQDKRRISWYKRSSVEPLLDEYKEILS